MVASSTLAAERSTATVAPPPIAATFARVADHFGPLGATFGARDGWQRAADVVSDPDAVRGLLDQVCELYEMDDRRVAASFLVLGYFWYPMVGALACYLLERRVPDLSASAIAVHLRDGVAFTSPHCWALPDDPAAADASVTVVGSTDELRFQIVTTLGEDHAAPLFATLRGVAPYGLPAMRANYLDRLASAVLWLAQKLGDGEIARREVPAFLALAGPGSRSGLHEIEHAGRRELFLRRGGCCLNYRLPGREKCDTCSLHRPAERDVLLRQHFTAAHAG